ncbi:hypothetical protein AGMMS49991_10130 [Spirochaetia bacterium]|nr:hypothetical protein AGMMS49991_10130 [Spirochaetia bacterium]
MKKVIILTVLAAALSSAIFAQEEQAPKPEEAQPWVEVEPPPKQPKKQTPAQIREKPGAEEQKPEQVQGDTWGDEQEPPPKRVKAQDTTTPGEYKNAVSIDVGPWISILTKSGDNASGFGLGAGYERVINNLFTAMATFAYAEYDINIDQALKVTRFDISAHARYYPLKSAFSQLFIDAGLGYSNTLIKSAASDEKASSDLFVLGIKGGWKFLFKKTFFLEPWISYTYAFETPKMPADSVANPADPVKMSDFSIGIAIGIYF